MRIIRNDFFVLCCDESACGGNAKTIRAVSALAAFNLKIQSICLLSVSQSLTCLSLPSLTPCSFLNEIDPVFNDSFTASYILKVHRQELHYTDLCNTSFRSDSLCCTQGTWVGMWAGNPRLLVHSIKSNMSRISV